MAYSIYTDHPESRERQQANFNTWLPWAEKTAPWSGVSVPDVAELMSVICQLPDMSPVCEKLDFGGVLTPEEAAQALSAASGAMTDKIRHIFEVAVRGSYGVRIEFSRGPFEAPTASEYMAKFGSETAH